MVLETLGITSDVFGQSLTGLVFLMKIIFAGLIALGGLFFVYKIKFEYPIPITLVRGYGNYGALDWYQDKGKIVKNAGDVGRRLVLMRQRDGKKRVSTEEPPSEFKGKKGKFDHYMFLMDNNYQLQPVKVDVRDDMEHPFLKMFPQDKLDWARKEDKRRLEKYAQQDMFSKYLPTMVVVLAFVITFFIAYFGFTQLGDGMSKLAGEFGNVAAQCAAF